MSKPTDGGSTRLANILKNMTDVNEVLELYRTEKLDLNRGYCLSRIYHRYSRLRRIEEYKLLRRKKLVL